MTAIEELLNRNHAKAMSHPYWVGPTPTLGVAMVLCMDAQGGRTRRLRADTR